jgi:hypothetical protein
MTTTDIKAAKVIAKAKVPVRKDTHLLVEAIYKAYPVDSPDFRAAHAALDLLLGRGTA